MKDRLFDIPFFGPKILEKVYECEGGDKVSKSLRDYYCKKYHVEVGMYSYGGCFVPNFNVGGKVKIGRYCSFASDVHFFGANHPVESAVMSAYFYNKKFSGFNVRDVHRSEIIIGNDVWVGYGAIILPSCSVIGNGAVIAAGAVVTKNVPPYAIVAGVPARIIRYRFESYTQDKMEKSEWWKLTPEELYKYYDKIESPNDWADEIIKYHIQKKETINR